MISTITQSENLAAICMIFSFLVFISTKSLAKCKSCATEKVTIAISWCRGLTSIRKVSEITVKSSAAAKKYERLSFARIITASAHWLLIAQS